MLKFESSSTTNKLATIVSSTITLLFYSAPVLECKPENRSARGPGGRPAPLLRSRTLPAIVAPGLNILQAQIDARYNGKYINSIFFFFFPPLSLYFSYKYCRIIVVSIHFLRQRFLCNIYIFSLSLSFSYCLQLLLCVSSTQLSRNASLSSFHCW